MKKFSYTILMLYAVFMDNRLAVAGVYDSEIKIINDSRNALLDKAKFVADKNKEFLLTWYSIGYQLKFVNVERFKISRTGNAEVDLYRNLVNESVHLSHSFSEFNVVKEKIEFLKQRSSDLCREADWLCSEHARNSKLIDENRIKFGQLLEQRKANLDLAMKKWTQRQVDIFLSDQARIRGDFVQGVKLDQLVSRLSSIFFNLNNKVRMAIIERNREKAEDALSAIVWFRSVVPVFFSDKVMTEYSRQILEGTLRVSEETENALRAQVNGIKYKSASLKGQNRMIASVMFAALYIGDDVMERIKEKGYISENDLSDPAFKEFDKNWVDLDLEKEGVDKYVDSDGILHMDFYDIDFSEKKFSEKSIHTAKVANGYESKEGANGSGKNSPDLEKGIVRISGGIVAENVKVESEREISNKVIEYVQNRFSRSEKDYGDFSSNPNSVGDLLGRSQSEVNRNFVSEFQKLKNANDDLRNTSETYQKVVDSAVKAANSVHAQINTEINGSINNLKQSEPGYSSMDSLPRVDGARQFEMVSKELHSMLNANSNVKLGSFEQFVKSAENSFGGHHSLESMIVQDAISSADSIESQPGRNYHEKKASYQLSRFERYVVDQRAAGGMSTTACFDMFGSLSKFAQENNIKKSDVIGINRNKPGTFRFKITERYKKIAAEVASIGMGFTPLGVIFDIYSLASSRDFFTGIKLTRDEMIFTAVGMTIGQGAFVRNAIKELKIAKAITQEAEIALKHGDEIAKSIETVEEFNSLLKGPLSEIKVGLSGKMTVADTFRSATYRKVVTSDETTKLYRVYGGESETFGSYWTRTAPTGPLQVLVDSALDQSINKTTHWVEITVPKGTVFYEGIAAPMSVKGGNLVGGGNQVYFIDKVLKEWITKEGIF